MLIYLVYSHEPILRNTINYVHFFSTLDFTLDNLHWMESHRVLMSRGLPTVPLRSTGGSRSTYPARPALNCFVGEVLTYS